MSIGSLLPFFEASAAAIMTSGSENPGNVLISPILKKFCVIVPVLSEERISNRGKHLLWQDSPNGIHRDDIPEPDMDDIAGHEFAGRDLLPCPVTEYAGIGSELLF